LRALVACLALLAAGAAWAQSPPVEGRDFRTLEPARPAPRDRLEVIEFFYYGCPVCYETEPALVRWLQGAGADVQLRRVPAANPVAWESFARTYYTLEALGELERLHWAVYDNHHFDDRRLDVEANIDAWIAANGVDAARFHDVWHSLETRQKVEFARRMLGTYDVHGVPTFVVDGRYVTSPKMAGGVKEAIAVLDALVRRARAERAAR